MQIEIDWTADRRRWEALADRAEAPLAQRWLYGATAERLGRQVRRAVVLADDAPVALAQFLSRRIFGPELFLATRGPVFLAECDPGTVRKALRRALPRTALKLISPERPLPGLKLSSAPEITTLDLNPPLDKLREGLHQKWRNALKKAEKSKLKVVSLSATPEAMRPLLQAEKARQKEGRYRGLPPEYALALHAVGPQSLQLFQAADAAMLFVRHGNSATYQIGHSGPEGQAANAHNLILWTAIARLKAEGVTRLELGSIDRKHAASLARFKLRSGAEARCLGPAQLL